MTVYICPCAVCPDCGLDPDFDPNDKEHPIDGLAHCYQKMIDIDGEAWSHREFWAVSGPLMDGRHIQSAQYEAAWRAYDEAIAEWGR